MLAFFSLGSNKWQVKRGGHFVISYQYVGFLSVLTKIYQHRTCQACKINTICKTLLINEWKKVLMKPDRAEYK
jgi:hypothetical protein